MNYKKNYNRIEELCRTATTFTEIETKLGLSTPNTGLRKFIKSNNIPMPLYEGQSSYVKSINKSKITEEDLCENSKRSTGNIKKFLFKKKLKQPKCEKCGWNNVRPSDGKIPVELHHINGINNDNRIENLQILCPNCHALTNNFAGKNKISDSRREKLLLRKVYYQKAPENICKGCNKLCHNKHYCCYECKSLYLKYPSKEELSVLIQTHSYVSLGKRYNVSDKTIRKWAKKYELI